MKLYRGKTLVGLAVMFVVLLTAVGAAQSEDIVLNSHYGFSGVITKIESGMLFVKTDSSLQPRTISPNKADRVGLYNAKVGDPVNVWSIQAMPDRCLSTDQSPDRDVVGTVRYADPFWHEIQLSTPEGTTTYEVDSLAGTKLSGFADGAPVTLELDADNVMIDIQRGRSR
jgi:hypothetical protein